MTFDTFDAVFFTAGFLVPGFIWSAVLSLLVPRRSTRADSRVYEFLTLSCVNNGLWSWALLLIFRGNVLDEHPLWSAAGVFLIIFASPVVLGLVSGRLRQTDAIARFLERLGFRTIDPIPTAWDFHFARRRPYWVVVTLKDGSRVFGVYGDRSYAGDDPSHRDLYLEAVYTPNDRDEWAPVEDTGGAWVAADQLAIVEFREFTEIDYGGESSE